MKLIGKIIGFFIGWMTGGPFLAALGLLIGHAFDKGLSFESLIQSSLQFKQQPYTQTLFFESVFSVMGFIAKSDGRISEDEIKQARLIMSRMGLSGSQKKQAIHYFTLGKQANFDLSTVLSNLHRAFYNQKNLLRLFIEIQFQTALIQGKISIEKQQILKYICEYLGFTPIEFTFEQFSGPFQQHYQKQTNHSYQKPIPDAYQVLGLTRQATDQEVKKAYRRLMSEHHPDKLISKGLPDSMIKSATEKTQKIKAAYDQICKARGIK